MVLNQDKKQVRNKLLEQLLSLTKEEIKRRSNHVEETLSALPLYKKAKIVMVYFPLKGEVNLLGMIRKDKEKRFCFPVMQKETNSLVPFEVRDIDRDFCPGPYGVQEPDLTKGKQIDVGEIDLVIVPGIGFDRSCNRLGRGAGFYDRFLTTIKPPTQSVGVAFDFQVLENLPIHPSFDQKLDAVASEGFLVS